MFFRTRYYRSRERCLACDRWKAAYSCEQVYARRGKLGFKKIIAY